MSTLDGSMGTSGSTVTKVLQGCEGPCGIPDVMATSNGIRSVEVPALPGLRNLAPWTWGSNDHGASTEIPLQPPLIRRCTISCDVLIPPATEYHCRGQAEGTNQNYSVMARVLWDGGLPATVACAPRPAAPSIRKQGLSFSSTTSLGRINTQECGGLTGNRRTGFENQVGSSRDMRSRALAEPEFPEKRDAEQMETMIPLSRNGKRDTLSASTMNAALTSVLPEYKFIHDSAVVHPDAVLGEGVIIGAFCTVGPGVKLGHGCKLLPGSHIGGITELGDGCEVMNGAVVGADIPGRTIIGHHNTIGYHAVVGVKCQDMKYKEGAECSLYIGNNNDIREYASIHRSSKATDSTVIGDNNLIMGSCHIAHDCKLGNHNILANGTLIGGHVMLEDYVHTGGAVAVHQFCHIDSYSFVAGGSMVDRDVPMYMMVSGDRAELRGLNLEGMRRLGFSDLEVKSIRRTYQKLFMNSDSEAGGLEDRLADLEANEELVKVPAVVSMLCSVRNCFGEKRRGICKFRHWTSV